MPPFRLSHLLVVVAVTAALLAGLDGLDPTPAKARRGYGGYKKCGKGCYTKKCRASCKKARRTCVYCVKQDTKPLKAACRGQGKACRAQVKAQVKALLQTCRGATGECRSCCRVDYGGSCNSSFEGTSGFGSYFHRSYGRRYKPDCDGTYAGGGGGTPRCVRVCERARAAALSGCRRGGCDVDAIEAEYQACLGRCGVATTTSTTLPPSPSGAFLPAS